MGWAVVGDVPEWRLVKNDYTWSPDHVLIESSAGRLILVKTAKTVTGQVVKEIPVLKHEIIYKDR